MTLENLNTLDQSATLWLNGLSGEVGDFLSYWFSNQFIWIPFYMLVAWLLIRRLGWKKGLAFILAAGLLLLCCDQFANLIKNTVSRPRPSWDSYMISHGLDVVGSKGGHYGFFSAHAANALSFAICMAYGLRCDRRHSNNGYISVLMVWALLVGLSRVFVGKHYLGDVLVGFVIGSCFGVAFGILTLRVIRRLFPETAGA